MQVVIRELVLRLEYSRRALLRAAAGRLGVQPSKLRLLRLLRRSIDARPIRQHPCYVVNAIFEVLEEINISGLKNVAAADSLFSDNTGVPVALLDVPLIRPVVVGAGPAGLLAALVLARAGVRPILLERGRPISQRRPAVGAFWGRGILDPENNVLYGEGGAGAFSDGKLTSRGKDIAGKDSVLQALVECGAPEDILYDAQAHLGSDVLAGVIPRLRGRIEELGGEVRFGARVEGVCRENGRLRGVIINGAELACDLCILATGHSAGDVYRFLSRAGVELDSKGYALGVRVELPQRLVDRSQWGRFAGAPGLGAASFFLTCAGRCHSFCMCPGGLVIACAQAPGLLATNGMSLSKRSGGLANAAFLIPQLASFLPVEPNIQGVGGANADDVSSPFLMDMLRLEKIERDTFVAGGEDYSLPATTLADFPSACAILPEVRSCRRARAADFRTFLPEPVWRELADCIPPMLGRLGRISVEDVVLYGAETRSTSPVRVVRANSGESVNTQGLFPAGEGAGYAGGIVSSAVDGLRAAQAALVALAAARGSSGDSA